MAPPASHPTPSVEEVWKRVVDACAPNPSVASAAEPLNLVRLEGGSAWATAPSNEALSTARARKQPLEEALARVLGRGMRLELSISADAQADQPSLPEDPIARETAMKHPLVRHAAQVLGARVIGVEADSAGST